MAKSPKSKKKEKKLDASISQITEAVPLAKRTKKEQKAHDKLLKFTKELNKDAWVSYQYIHLPLPHFLEVYGNVSKH